MTETHGIYFQYQSGLLFITLPSGRRLSYVRPRIGENRFGGESVTYEGTGIAKKWERIESYGPKFVENIVQAISRDILCYAMRTLSYCFIVGHVHDARDHGRRQPGDVDHPGGDFRRVKIHDVRSVVLMVERSERCNVNAHGAP